MLARADSLAQDNKLSDAACLLERYLQLHPNDTDVLRALARTYMALNRPEEAAEIFAGAQGGLLSRRTKPGKFGVAMNGTVQADEALDHTERDLDYLDEQARSLQQRRQRFELPSEECPASQKRVSPSSSQHRPGQIDQEKPKELPEANAVDASSDLGDPTATDADPFGAPSLSGEDVVDLSDLENLSDAGTLLDDLDESTSDDEVAGILDEPAIDADVSNERVPETSAADHDWDVFDAYLHEIDEEPIDDEPEVEIQTEGRISRKDRAMQEAIKLGTRYGWDESGISLLAEVFDKYWWSKAKHSMEREIEAGLLPDELKLALVARDIWREYGEFSINLDGHDYAALSWPLALRIVRSFRSYPDSAEIEQFLYEAYMEWSTRCSLTRVYRSYFDYLVNRLHFQTEMYFASPSVTLDDGYDDQGDEYFSGMYSSFNTEEHQSLVEYGLIPDIWVSRFAVRNNEEYTQQQEIINVDADHDE